MFSLHIFAQASAVDSLTELKDRVGIDLPHLISSSIAFLIVAVGLTYFAYNPVRKVLEARRKTIEESMLNAEKIKKELADAEAARLSIIQKANEQAQAIILEAEKTAGIRTEQLARDASRQAEDIVRKAHEAAVLDRDRLMAELKHQVGALVIQTTEKVAGKVLTSDDQSRLHSETLRQLSAPNN